MITQQDLQAAIAECLAVQNPNSNTCIKLAAFYTIREHLFPEKSQLPVDTSPPQLSYAYAPPPGTVGNMIDYESDTEFGRLIRGRDPSEVWPLVDELVSEVLAVLNPRLYEGFIRRLK